MAKMTPVELLDAFKEMTALELADFVKDFEDLFGVTAAVPASPDFPGNPVNPLHDVAAEEDYQTEWDVVLTAPGDKKIQVIKEVRVLTKLGLKEAKDLVDNTPAAVLENVDRDEAQRARERLEAAGAAVTVQ